MGLTAAVLGVLAWTSGALWALPQLVRVLSRRSTEGVSAAAQLVALAGTAGFGLYGVLVHDAALVASRPLTLASTGAVAYLAAREGREGRLVLAGVAAVCVLGTVLTVHSPAALALWSSVLVTVPVLPQAWAVRRSDDLGGVSATTWLLVLATDALWALYGLAVQRPWLAAPLVAGALPAAYVVGAVTRSRSPRRRQLLGEVVGAGVPQHLQR